MGDYKGFKIFKDGPSLRIHFGHISICIANIDIEELIECQLFDLHASDAEKDMYNEALAKFGDLELSKDEMLKQLSNYEKEMKVFADEIKENEHRIDEIDDERIDALDENDVLQDEIKELKAQLKSAKNELDYLLIYFHLKFD